MCVCMYVCMCMYECVLCMYVCMYYVTCFIQHSHWCREPEHSESILLLLSTRIQSALQSLYVRESSCRQSNASHVLLPPPSTHTHIPFIQDHPSPSRSTFSLTMPPSPTSCLHNLRQTPSTVFSTNVVDMSCLYTQMLNIRCIILPLRHSHTFSYHRRCVILATDSVIK